jgi:hypothetical protein
MVIIMIVNLVLLRTNNPKTGNSFRHLEMSVNFGFPFLFENLDEYLDPVSNKPSQSISIVGKEKSEPL